MRHRYGHLIKRVLAVVVIVATGLLFYHYLANNRDLLVTILNLNAQTLILLTIGYTLVLFVNSLVLYYSLCTLKKTMPLLENVLLSGYSSIINFFGPLQSGPGVRALYLKKLHDVPLKKFFMVTLVFYAFFALINGFILAVAALQKYSTFALLLAVMIALPVLAVIFRHIYRKSDRIKTFFRLVHIKDRNFWLIGAGALALTLVTAFIYLVEIKHINPSVSFAQVLVYTASADLALFVSLTPGAIGIRESFLLVSQSLHGIDTGTIIGASVIDRAFYVVYLLLLFAVLVIINTKKPLAVFRHKTDNQSPQPGSKNVV